MRFRVRRREKRGAVVCAVVLCAMAAAGGAFAVQDIQLTLVDPNATGYGTFQSHNQKVVSNDNGIFITYVHSYEDPLCTWRMARSTDGGLSFATIYERNQENGEHSAPAIETDENANIYLAVSEYGSTRFFFIRFLASEDYQTPHQSEITVTWCAGKFAMAYDQPRQRFYVATQPGGLFSVAPDGTVIDSTYSVWASGPNGGPHYPHLHMDDSGTLYYAETAGDATGLPDWAQYRSILCLKSPDGGATWQRLDGTTVAIPVAGDETGEATTITEASDLTIRSWLSNTLTKGGRTHFWYARATDEYGTTPAIPYVNYDTTTGQRQHWQNLMESGTQVKVTGWDGFFATKDLGPDSALYVVLNDGQGRMACLSSPDNGENWYDYALATESHWPYATGGARRVTADGHIIGTYTAATGPGNAYQIWFFRIFTTLDADGDGLKDIDETRDLDPGTPGVQNPFDPALRDSTGNGGQDAPDGVSDGQNDWDSDGMSNADEFIWGFNPMNPVSFGSLPTADAVGLGMTVWLLALGSVIVLRKRKPHWPGPQ